MDIQIDPAKIDTIINRYVDRVETLGLDEYVSRESYKFAFVDTFQNNFDIDSQDFVTMLDTALPISNLNGGGNYFPRKMLLLFAEENPEKIRTALRALFDESNPVDARITEYRITLNAIMDARNKLNGRNDGADQDLRFVSLLLAFRYPERYYHYKASSYSAYVDSIAGKHVALPHDILKKYDIVSWYAKALTERLASRADILPIKQALTSQTIYKDESNLWITQDIIYSTSIDLEAANTEVGQINYWLLPLTTDQIHVQVPNSVAPELDSLDIGDVVYVVRADEMKLHSMGIIVQSSNGGATELKIIREYTDPQQITVNLSQNNLQKLSLEQLAEIQKDLAKSPHMPVWLLSLGENQKHLSENVAKGTISIGWDRLGDLRRYDSRQAIADQLQALYPENGDTYPRNNAAACDEFKQAMLPGDIVVIKSGTRKLLALGQVTGDYSFDDTRSESKHVRPASFSLLGEWSFRNDTSLHVKTLTELSPYPDYVRTIIDSFNDKPENEELSMSVVDNSIVALNKIYYGPPGTGKTYRAINKYAKALLESQEKKPKSHSELLADNFVDLSWWEVVALTLDNINNPVTVKTIIEHDYIQSYAKFVKQRDGNIANTIWALLQDRSDVASSQTSSRVTSGPLIFSKNDRSEWSLNNDGRIYVAEALPVVQERESYDESNETTWQQYYRTVTFHQSFSYEEFVEGIRPDVSDENDGQITYKIVPGVFKEMAMRAAADPDNKYLLIIDEINRGNIAKIFGELITLLEDDKRGVLSVILPYSKELFTVPKNLHVLGTMNTSDRSIALLDIALRRRFSFEELMPEYDQLDREVSGVHLGNLLKNINDKISIMIDREHQIGHSYFMKVNTPDELHAVWYEKIIPLLQEYFYNDWERLQVILGNYKPNDNSGFIATKSQSELVNLFGADSEYADTIVGSVHVYGNTEIGNALNRLLSHE